jgi:prepilin-type N-terminal cleavage/methylation domain-containing protein
MKHQCGLSLIELLIAVTLAGILIASMQGVVGQALNAESSIRARNNSLQQGRFAMQMMVKSVRMTRRLILPLGENSTTAYSESERDVLAVTLDPTVDRDKDGWADANNDKDYLDINNNGSRDSGEPERIDEDPGGDVTNDGASGILNIDDDGDGVTDEQHTGNGPSNEDDDEDGTANEDSWNGMDDDGDNTLDEDPKKQMSEDNKAGIALIDDDYDGTVDEGDKNDDDEDGQKDEDWLDAVVYFLNGTTLMQRVPNLNPTDGTDFQENPIAENVTAFQVIRIPQGNGRRVLIEITLAISSNNAEPVNFNTRIGIGSGL